MTRPTPDVGDTIIVTYTDDYRGHEHTVTGTVVVNPSMYRDTPDDTIDVEIPSHGIRRITPDDRFKSLHYATRRHDHFIGHVVGIDVVETGRSAQV